MLIRDKDLMTLAVPTGDGTRHAVDDLLLSTTDLAARAVVLDVGGWFEDRKAVVGIERFDEPDVEGGTWPAAVGRADLDDAARSGGQLLAHRGDAAPAPGAAPRTINELLTGTTVRAEDTELGKLMGVIFDSDGWRAAYLVVETGSGKLLAEHQRVVPVSAIRDFEWTAQSVTLEGPAAQFHDSPDLHQIDGVEGKWYNKVMAYYGLQS